MLYFILSEQSNIFWSLRTLRLDQHDSTLLCTKDGKIITVKEKE